MRYTARRAAPGSAADRAARRLAWAAWTGAGLRGPGSWSRPRRTTWTTLVGATHEDRVVAVFCGLVVELGVGARQRLEVVGVAGGVEAGVSVGHRVERGRRDAATGCERGDRGVHGHPGGDRLAGLGSVDDRYSGVAGGRELDDAELAQPQ